MPVNEKRILSMLGLAAKAGNLVSGEFSVEKAVKEHKAFLVIVAGDASDNTKKNFRNILSPIPKQSSARRLLTRPSQSSILRSSLASLISTAFRLSLTTRLQHP